MPGRRRRRGVRGVVPIGWRGVELVEEGEGLLDDVAEFAQALDVRGALAGDDRHDPACAQFTVDYRESYALSPRMDSGRRRGWPGRPATGGMPSTRTRVCVVSLTFAAVVMTWSGVPIPSQTRWCLLPVFRRSTGDGPVASPLFGADVGAV